MDTTYRVDGMHCDHCVRAVSAEVLQVPGVRAVRVALDQATVTVTSDDAPDEAAIRSAVEQAGYAVAR